MCGEIRDCSLATKFNQEDQQIVKSILCTVVQFAINYRGEERCNQSVIGTVTKEMLSQLTLLAVLRLLVSSAKEERFLLDRPIVRGVHWLQHPVQRRILDGYEVKERTLPWQVSLRRGNKHYCGGSLISNELVLTAAHCLIKVKRKLNARVGSLYRDHGGMIIYSVKIVWHEDYDPNITGNSHDIGLVFLDRSVRFSNDIKPLYLPSPYMEIPTGVKTLSSGWGTISFPETLYPEVLLAVDMQIISKRVCKEMLGPLAQIGPDHICAYSGTHGRGTCRGDSGGPLTFGNNLLGVVSWGIPCAQGVPDIFTKVSYYIGWILKQCLEHIIERETEDDEQLETE